MLRSEAIRGQGHHTQCRKALGSHRYKRGGRALSCHQHGSLQEGVRVCVCACVMVSSETSLELKEFS